jgi:hypothetical protein
MCPAYEGKDLLELIKRQAKNKPEMIWARGCRNHDYTHYPNPSLAPPCTYNEIVLGLTRSVPFESICCHTNPLSTILICPTDLTLPQMHSNGCRISLT